MTGYEVYIFVLCLVVFVALTAFFATMITCMVKMYLKLIRGGIADEDIQRQRDREEKRTAVFRTLETVVSVLFLTVAIAIFSLSLGVKINEKKPVGRSVIKVVKSPSMSVKDEYNRYLFENNLNNQIQMFDLIRMEPLPAEDGLKLYDIVIYEVNGQMVIHRIVDIKEPDETHAQRRFVLQGDANRYSDKFPVLYSQMRGIYEGKKIPYIGSFIIFMNSPAGWLCILLVVVTCAVYPFIDKKIRKEIALRLAAIQAESAHGQQQQGGSEASVAQAHFLKPVGNPDAGVEHTGAFIKPRGETLEEKYLNLSGEQKRFYDEIVTYAASVQGSKRTKNERYEEYKSGKNRLVRVLIKRDTVVCEYLIRNENFGKYIDGNKVRVKHAPASLKVTDENTLRAAKDSIDIAKSAIEEERLYKKEQAKIRRRERRSMAGRRDNE